MSDQPFQPRTRRRKLLSAQDRADLTRRLAILSADEPMRRDLEVLARNLTERAARRWQRTFEACSAQRQELILNEIMQIDAKSKLAYLLSRLSRSERDLKWPYLHPERDRYTDSSAQSIGGALQPSLTIAALALRLADHLYGA